MTTIPRTMEQVAAIVRAAQPKQHALPGEWQPIETAPKSKRVLVCWELPGGTMHVEISLDINTGDGQWWSRGDYYTTRIFPAHWMPLPEPQK